MLKDADATAIYGSRASNGVILITTKKGKAGKTHAEISAYTGYSRIPRYYSMLNTSQYVSMRKEALENDGLPLDANNAPDLIVWDTSRYTDWQEYLWGGTGRVVNSQVSVSGGDTRTSFRAGGGYSYHRDILAVSGGNHRGSLSLNLNHKSVNQKFSLSWSNLYGMTSSNLIAMPAGAVILPPNAPAVFDNGGNLNYAGWESLSYLYRFSSLGKQYTAKSNWLNSNITLGYELVSGLTVKASIGYNNSQNRQTQQVPIASQNPIYNLKGLSSFGYTNFHNLIIEPQVEYNTFLRKGKLAVLFGGTAQHNMTDGLAITGNNYTNDALLGSINNAPNVSTVNNNGQYKYTGAFARVNYNWENKYILNLNARRDGSSRFGPGRQFGNFGSVGGAWLFSEEKFVQNKLPWMSFGKLRGSYGITGGDQIGDYEFLSLWQFRSGSSNYNGYMPLIPSGHSDSLLQWQVNKKLELAVNLGFIKDRLNLQISWYRNRCDNQLISFPLPGLTGFTYVTSNTPANVENKGWEFILNGKILDSKDFKWSGKINVGINRNKLLSYPNFEQSPYANSFIIGMPLNLRRYLQSTGVDPQTGLYTFTDKTKDGNISINPGPANDYFVYDMTQRYEGGFTSNFSFRDWSLSLFFHFKKQKGFSATTSAGFPGSMNNQPSIILDHWRQPEV